jgi:hypothetical protein
MWFPSDNLHAQFTRFSFQHELQRSPDNADILCLLVNLVNHDGSCPTFYFVEDSDGQFVPGKFAQPSPEQAQLCVHSLWFGVCGRC